VTITQSRRSGTGKANRFFPRVPEGRLNRSSVPPGLDLNGGAPPSHEWLAYFRPVPPGRRKDDCFFSTNLALSPKAILELFALRWPLEVTFYNAKDRRINNWRDYWGVAR